MEEAANGTAIVPPYAAPAEPVLTATDTTVPESSGNTMGYMLGALAVLAVPLLAILAILPARRRRKALAKPEAQVAGDVPKRTEWPVESTKPTPIVVSASAESPAPVTEGPYDNRVATFSHSSAPVRGALPANGAAVPLPARMPENFEERDALLKRMAAARPDRANPFGHYKSRIKRARLILQSLGRKFENVDPWIDLSEYPNNWPELARRKYLRAA